MKKPPKSNGLFPACLKFDLKMKLSLLFFVTASFVMQASVSYSQKTKISLNKESVTVKEVIDEIETTTEFKFLFNTKAVDLNRRVSLNVRKVPVNIILDLLFKGTDTSYEIDDRKVLLTKTKEAKTALIIAQPNLPDLPPVQIKGTIVDSNGQPLPSANVVEKGTKTGVTTDFDGKFALNVSNENAILIVSYIGFDTQEVSLKGQATIKIVLKESAAGLNEVVVVGYGTQKKRDITGSVSSINKNAIKDLVLTSTEQALKGQAAGVQMTQSSSAPGGGASVRIRGGNSISAGNEPLYVIDGFPIYNDSSNSTGVLGNGQPTNVLASINPSDIESMEILKDASATAIYGARGANGVIIITTKRGKSGQANVSFETYYGFQQLSKKIDLVNAYDFAKNANVDNIQRVRPIIYPDPEIYNPAVYGQGTDWQDEAFRIAPTQNYQLGFTGGNDQTKYAISGNYFTQDGILRGSDFTRGSIRVNLDQNLSSKFKLGLSFTASRTANNQAKTDTDLDANNIGAITSILYAPPTAPVYAADGSYNRFIGPDGSFYGNPVASLLEIKNLSRTDRVMGNVFLDYKITKDLLFKVSFGGDQINVKDDYYLPAFIQNTGQNARARIGVNQSFSWLNENTLTYTKTFAEKHNFTALGGFTRQKFTSENVTTGADRFVNDVLEDGSLGSGAIVVPPTSNINEWALESYIARINYGYNDKYLLTLTGRADGSSRFGESNKFSFFPSGSLAWRVSQEDFMKSTEKVISNLKLRVSYGQTGNTEIPTYRSLAALGGTSNYPIGGVITSGVASTRVANPNLKWETTSQFDAGIDLSLFSNRINIVADYYDKRTEDLLLDVQIPGTSGYQTSLQNVGSVRNHGIELALNTVNFDGDFKWKTSFNITFNKNEVTDLGGDYERPAGGGSASKAIANTGILRVGEPVGLFYGYLTDGLFQTPTEVAAGIASGQAGVQLGDRRYKDVNGDGKLDANDRTILGYAQPDFFYGMTNTFSYKNFDLNVLINGVQGNDVLNLNVNAETDINAPDSNNRWTPTNTNTDVPRTTKETRLTNKQVEDGSYLRIQNISFGYEMPKIVFKNTFVQSVRLYVSLQNYFTFTNYKGYNPDVNSFGQDNLSIGVDRGGYPAAKTFLMGLNVKL